MYLDVEAFLHTFVIIDSGYRFVFGGYWGVVPQRFLV